MKLKRAAREAKSRKEAADASKQEDAALASQVEHLEKTLKRGEERHEELQRAEYISDEASHRTAKTLRTELAALNEEIARAREARRAADARKAEIDGEVSSRREGEGRGCCTCCAHPPRSRHPTL